MRNSILRLKTSEPCSTRSSGTRRRRRSGRWSCLLAAVMLLIPWSASQLVADEVPTATAEAPSAAEPSDSIDRTKYMQIRVKKQSPQALETAIVRFVPAEKGGPYQGVTVDLIGAVHIGDASYYDELNRRFTGYDSVLYELVADEESRIPRPGEPRGNHPVSFMQRMMKDLLELEFQLDGIDYTADNLIHADMSPEEFAQSMEDRGESFLTLFLQMMAQAMAKQQSGSGTSDLELLIAFFHKDRALALKRILAEEFEDVEASMSFLSGPEGSTILTERNKVALKVLEERIAEGDRKVAIFYGAGHLPDLARRLRDDFGLVPAKTTWVEAWDLTGETD